MDTVVRLGIPIAVIYQSLNLWFEALRTSKKARIPTYASKDGPWKENQRSSHRRTWGIKLTSKMPSLVFVSLVIREIYDTSEIERYRD